MVGECCVTEQYVMLGVLIGLSILLCAVWRFPPLKPLKLFAVLLHESGHAGATVLSCGKVESIEVHGDEGGVTKHRGGKWWCVLPAGYVGGAVFGSAFIIASGSPLGSVICCGVLALILLFVLCYARSWWAFGLAITTVILMGAAVALYLFKVDTRAYFARIVIGIAGVLNCLFAVYDIVDDTIKRQSSDSDAEQCAKHISCCSGKCIGVCWVIYSIVFFALAVFISIFFIVPIDDDMMH